MISLMLQYRMAGGRVESIEPLRFVFAVMVAKDYLLWTTANAIAALTGNAS